ncbi:MAG: efflux RND transporter periplasmic adaptor subunit [Bryobacteraceae bacterium]
MQNCLQLLVLTGFFLLTSACQSDKSASAASSAAGPKPRQVRLIRASEEQVARAIEATGTLAAQDRVDLAMKVTGRVATLTVDLGDHVTKGQVIASLEPTELRIGIEQSTAALQQARSRLGLMSEDESTRVDPLKTATVKQAAATLNEARLDRQRAQQLFDQKLIARSDLDAAVAAFQVAEGRYQDSLEEIRTRQGVLAQRQSELQLARQRLTDASLRSPMDGAVAERHASVGQYLAAGSPVVTIVRINPLRLRIPIPERAASGVRVGQQVKLRADEDSTEYFGRVARLSPSIDETNRTLMVEAEVPNPRGLLKPGTFVRAELVTQSNQPALFVPATAIVTFAGLEKVITVSQGKSVERLVKTGRKDAVRVEIVEGLKAGEEIVLRPGNLVGGQPVVVAQK